ASVDDVFVIVLFTSFLSLAQGGSLSAAGLLEIPAAILTGFLTGAALGIALSMLFRRLHLRDTGKVIVLLSLSFLLVALEGALKGLLPFSGLLAVMSMGAALQKQNYDLSKRLSGKFSKLWVAAEVLLFVLVGATVDVRYAVSAGLAAIAVVFGALLFRMAGVFCCMIKTRLTPKERLFCMIAYLPKATVQAAIGAIPLSMGLPCGKVVLTVAVLAILITAPLGALGIDLTYKKLLHKQI
ncbi:MAG: cation:proton antiporter, partial [Angelakisella sp.]